jgi:putative transposase
MKKRFTEEQIIKTLKRSESGEKVKDLCRELGIASPTFYSWKQKYSGMEVSEAKRLRELAIENERLKKIVANQSLDILMLKEVNSRKW